MRISIAKIINPIYIILFTYTFQFLVWFFFFEDASDLFLVWKEQYFSLSAILKHIIFTGIFILAILFGMSFANKQIIVHKSNIFDIKINWFIYTLLILFLIGEFSILFILMKNFSSLIGLVQSKSLTVFTYYFREHKPIISTLVNVFPLIVILIIFNKHFNNKKIWLYFIGFLILLQSIFLTARILIINYILLISVAYAIKNNLKVSIKQIFFFLFILILLIVLAEIFRSGLINSVHENIMLFSIENICFVIKYLLTAYIGSDVNNSLIFYDSKPNLDFVYGSTKFIHNFFDNIFHFDSLDLIHPIERHGTMNLLSIFWIGWGYYSIAIILITGFFIGYSYILGVKRKNDYWLVIYLIMFPAILFSLRQNYFFQPFLLYSLVLFIFLNILIKVYRRI